MVAARNPDVAFIVMMAGTGVPGDELLVVQGQLISEASGLAHETAEKNAATERKALEIVKQETDVAMMDKKLRELLGPTLPEAQLGAQIKQITSPWFRYFLVYDPAVGAQQSEVPRAGDQWRERSAGAAQAEPPGDPKSSPGRRQQEFRSR